MYVDDLDIPVGKISDPVRRIIDRAIDESRRRGGGELPVTLSTKLVCKLALHHASRTGHLVVDGADLFIAMLQETSGVPVSIVRQHGVDPEVRIEGERARATWSCATNS